MNRRNFIGFLSAIPFLSKLVKKPASLPMETMNVNLSNYQGDWIWKCIEPACGDMRYDRDSGEMYVFGGNKDGWKKLI